MYVLFIGIGGFCGAVARYGISMFMSNVLGNSFPYGTLSVNLLGSFLMGFLSMILVSAVPVDPRVRVMVLTGFLGALTTFSTFIHDSYKLVTGEGLMSMGYYMIISYALGLGLFVVGITAARAILRS